MPRRMIMRTLWGLTLGAIISAWAQPGGPADPTAEVVPKDTPDYYQARQLKDAEFGAYLGDLKASLENAEGVLVFEGLPHPVVERDLLASERSTKKVTVLHDAEFYSGPTRPTAEQLAGLPARIVDSLTEYRGMKLCGGFHADYAVTWQAEGQRWTALFCHGCGEAAIFGPNGSLMADLGGPQTRMRREWLAQFDKVRPRARAR